MSALDEDEISDLHASLLTECDEPESVLVVLSEPSTPVTERPSLFDLLRSRSLQSSPTNLGSSVRSSSVKNLNSIFDTPGFSNMAELKAKSESSACLTKIRYAKVWVTRTLNTLRTALLAGADTIPPEVFNEQNKQFQDQCDKIIIACQVMGNIYNKHKVEAQFETIHSDIETYLKGKQEELDQFAVKVERDAADAEAPITKADLLSALSHSQPGQEQIKVSIDCPKFKGDESDRLAFKNWYESIDVIVKSRHRWSEEYKLFFLKDKVIGNAAAFIAHIDPGPNAYDTCIAILKEQYLNVDYIIDEYFKKLLSDKPEYDLSYMKSRNFIANTRNHLHNLKTHYGVDLLYETHNAHKLLSHIIFSKFSIELRQAFKWELKTEYPTFAQILESYCRVTNHLSNFKADKALQQSKSSERKSQYKSTNNDKFGFNFNTQLIPFTLHCRFCVQDGHNSNDCNVYATYQQRISKCKELKLCTQCTSPKHSPGPSCPASKKGPGGLYKFCKYCNSDKHVAALCNVKKSTPQLMRMFA